MAQRSKLPLLAALAAAANHAPVPTGMPGPPAAPPQGIGAMAGLPGPGGVPMPPPTRAMPSPPPAAPRHNFAGRPIRKASKRK